MSTFIRKSHNVSVLLYHLVCGSKYRRAVFNAAVDPVLTGVCLEISVRYEITFLEIGANRGHVHFLMQSVPTYSPTQIARTVKSITAKEIFRRVPTVKQQLWGGAFWSSGYFMDTVGRHGSEETIRRYVQEQGTEAGHRSRAPRRNTSACTCNRWSCSEPGRHREHPRKTCDTAQLCCDV